MKNAVLAGLCDRAWNPVSPRNAADSDLLLAGGALGGLAPQPDLGKGLRAGVLSLAACLLGALAVDHSQRRHPARIPAAHSEIHHHARRTGSLRIHELGTDLALSLPRSFPGVLETERRSHRNRRYFPRAPSIRRKSASTSPQSSNSTINDLNLTAEEDQQFAGIARARTARHPLRTYLWVPLQRVVTLWFTPRIEQLPISGSIFPLAQTWDTDRQDMSVTVGLFLPEYFLRRAGAMGCRPPLAPFAGSSRGSCPAGAALSSFGPHFLTTIETPEPRYVLCASPLIALAAHAFTRRFSRA